MHEIFGYRYKRFLVNKMLKINTLPENMRLYGFFSVKEIGINKYCNNEFDTIAYLVVFLILYTIFLYKMHAYKTFSRQDLSMQICRFRKFFIFLRFILYFREFRKLSNILFYFNPSASALASIYKYRICTLSLVDSKINAVGCVNYPISISYRMTTAKFFYSHLLINCKYLGKIILLLRIIH